MNLFHHEKMKENVKDKINNIKMYTKDNVFDNFDISDLLNKDLLIPKTELKNFLYKKDLNNSNITSTSTNDISQSDKSQDEIISEINNSNYFNIEIEKLILTYQNGYEVPFIDKYQPIKLIGQGHFGLVLSVLDKKLNIKMAVKIIKKKSFSDEYYLSETHLLNKLHNNHIIKLYDVVDTSHYLFIFTELCLGGSLKDYIISKYNSNNNYFMKDSECSLIIKNIMEGVKYLANNGIIHRDLKPENIMFRKENDINSLVLCDFGLAKQTIGNNFLESKCGTLIFMAPEVIMNRPYDSLVDIWSIGIIMYILESGGSHPLYNSAYSTNFVQLIKNKKKINFPDFFPSIARNFFMKLCKYETFFRYNINKALNHPWIIRTNRKIPLTIIENYEKESKIKNFKNMMLSFIYLKQLKYLFKKINRSRSKTIKAKSRLLYKYKLMSPIFNLDKNIFNINNIKENSIKENETNLPPILKPLLPNLKNKIFTAKSNKLLNILNKDLKPINLFNKENKNNNINKLKYNGEFIKKKNRTYRLNNSSIKIHNLKNDCCLEQNSFNKNSSFIEKNLKYYNDKENNKYRIYSSKKKFSRMNFMKKISSLSPKIGDVSLEKKEQIIKSFIN